MKRLVMLILALCAVAAAQQCNLVGTYAASYDNGWGLMAQQGSPLPLTFPGVILGVVSISYNGVLSGGETVMIAGEAKEYEISGKIEINPDCTGTLREFTRLKGSSDPLMPITERFVALVPSTTGQVLEIRTIILPLVGAPVGAMGNGVWRRINTVAGSVSW